MQSHLGFELVLPYSFPTTVSITPGTPPKSIYIYISKVGDVSRG